MDDRIQAITVRRRIQDRLDEAARESLARQLVSGGSGADSGTPGSGSRGMGSFRPRRMPQLSVDGAPGGANG